MACPSSGQIKISDIVAEFSGSAPHSLKEYYRNGDNVPGNNTNVAESGQITLKSFYDAVNEIGLTVSTGQENYNLATAFSSNWASAVPKVLTINSGVTIGGTGSSAALIIPSGMGGTLTVQNSGTVVGYAGAANGGDGGTAVQCLQNGNVTWNNLSGSALYGGGGGGGQGGTGGAGGAGAPGRPGGAGGNGGCTYWDDGNWPSVMWQLIPHSGCSSMPGGAGGAGGSGGSAGAGGTTGGTGGAGGIGQGYNQSAGAGSGGASGSAGSPGGSGSPGSSGSPGTAPWSQGYSFEPGGPGGAGGAGSAGGAGGQAGTGGTGGAGGAYGTDGSAGASGAQGATGGASNTGGTGTNGTWGNTQNGTGAGTNTNGGRTTGSPGNDGVAGSSGSPGSAGSPGGTRGYYIQNISYLTLNNSGTVAGRT